MIVAWLLMVMTAASVAAGGVLIRRVRAGSAPEHDHVV